MAITQFGAVAAASTTVSASPTPTTTVFTVASSSGFYEQTWIQVLVSAVYERTKISSIVGNVITVSPALSGTPDTPGSVEDRGELLTNERMNELVDAINAGVTSAWSTVTTDQSADTGNGYVANSTSRLNFTLPSTFTLGSNIVLKSKNTGGFKITPASGDSVYYGNSALTKVFAIVGSKYPAATLTCIEADTLWAINCEGGSGVLWFDFTKGYFAGGYNGSAVQSTIDKLTFSTEAISNLGATLNTARWRGCSGASNVSDKGYCFTGTTTVSESGGITEIDGINMSTDAAINPAATLATARTNVFSMTDYIGDKIFIAGGYNTSSTLQSSIEKFTSSTETVTAVTDTLTRSTIKAAGYTSATTGYGAGGAQSSSPAAQLTLASFNYANEAAEETRNVIKAIQNGASPPVDAAIGLSMVAASYHDGGYLFSAQNGNDRQFIIGKILNDSGAEIHMTTTLSVTRGDAGVTQSSDKAYIAGNDTGGSGNGVNSITSYDFVNDTQSTISAVLVGTRNAPFGFPQ